MALDPDDPRPPYVQVAAALRAAILTRTFRPGEKLPSGPQLAERYGVARMTVQNALRQLRDEGLIVSRQGSGVFVRERTERPVGLRPHIERAFDREHVTIDFSGFSGETLHGAMQEPLDNIRIGRLTPQSIRIRVLLPDTEMPWTLPCRTEALGDDPAFRERARAISQRSTRGIVESIRELADLGLVKEVTAEVRVHRTAALFKLYLLNETEAFFGFYPVREHSVRIAGEAHNVFDLMGKDAVLFHHSIDDDAESTNSQYVSQAQIWFDSMWGTVAREVPQ